MTAYRVTFNDHRCRPIEAPDWRDAVQTGLMRVYGPRAFSPSMFAKFNHGHAYIDVYRSRTARERRKYGDAAPLFASHVEVTVHIVEGSS